VVQHSIADLFNMLMWLNPVMFTGRAGIFAKKKPGLARARKFCQKKAGPGPARSIFSGPELFLQAGPDPARPDQTRRKS